MIIVGISGTEWTGFGAVSLRRGIESLSPVLTASVSGAPVSDLLRIAIPGAECTATVRGGPTWRLRVDQVRAVSSGQPSVTMTARSMAAILVDCAAIVPGQALYGGTAASAIRAIAGHYGVPARASGRALAALRGPVVISQGESAWEAISRVAAAGGFWVTADPDGGISCQDGWSVTPRPMPDGVVTSWETSTDASKVHDRYRVLASGGSASDAQWNDIPARWADVVVGPGRRTTVIQAPSPSANLRSAGLRAAALAKARARTLRITTPYAGEPPWEIGDRLRVVHRPLLIDGDFAIADLGFSYSEAGSVCDLTLTDPAAIQRDIQPHLLGGMDAWQFARS